MERKFQSTWWIFKVIFVGPQLASPISKMGKKVGRALNHMKVSRFNPAAATAQFSTKEHNIVERLALA